MADEEKQQVDAEKKRSRLPVLLGLVLAIAGGGGGFFAVQAGLLPIGESAAEAGHTGSDSHDGTEAIQVKALPEVDFVPIEPLIISLTDGRNTHLRFRAQLEVRRPFKAEVEHLMPRIVDVLNSYLRAVDLTDLQNSAALVRLRAQMLRRVQVVTGGDRVRDLLIMEFVLN